MTILVQLLPVIVTVKSQEPTFPAASVAVYGTMVSPIGNLCGGVNVEIASTAIPLLSEAVGTAQLTELVFLWRSVES